MPQSSVILFYLVAGFLVFVVSKGELPAYVSFLTGTASHSGSSAAPSTQGQSGITQSPMGAQPDYLDAPNGQPVPGTTYTPAPGDSGSWDVDSSPVTDAAGAFGNLFSEGGF